MVTKLLLMGAGAVQTDLMAQLGGSCVALQANAAGVFGASSSASGFPCGRLEMSACSVPDAFHPVPAR